MSSKSMILIGHQSLASKTIQNDNPVTEAAPLAPAGDDNYIIAVSNQANVTLTRACYNFDPKGNNNWIPIPHTSRNCSSSCDACLRGGNYAAIMNVNCRESHINLTIATTPDPSGTFTYATFDVYPDCQHAGGVLCVG